jgi:hypothetical protein
MALTEHPVNEFPGGSDVLGQPWDRDAGLESLAALDDIAELDCPASSHVGSTAEHHRPQGTGFALKHGQLGAQHRVVSLGKVSADTGDEFLGAALRLFSMPFRDSHPRSPEKGGGVVPEPERCLPSRQCVRASASFVRPSHGERLLTIAYQRGYRQIAVRDMGGSTMLAEVDE